MPDEELPASIREAIRAATDDQASFSIACRLYVEDASDSRSEAHLAEARLEHAVARATLDAWLHGVGSKESGGFAYVVVANRVAQTSRRVMALARRGS